MKIRTTTLAQVWRQFWRKLYCKLETLRDFDSVWDFCREKCDFECYQIGPFLVSIYEFGNFESPPFLKIPNTTLAQVWKHIFFKELYCIIIFGEFDTIWDYFERKTGNWVVSCQMYLLIRVLKFWNSEILKFLQFWKYMRQHWRKFGDSFEEKCITNSKVCVILTPFEIILRKEMGDLMVARWV